MKNPIYKSFLESVLALSLCLGLSIVAGSRASGAAATAVGASAGGPMFTEVMSNCEKVPDIKPAVFYTKEHKDEGWMALERARGNDPRPMSEIKFKVTPKCKYGDTDQKTNKGEPMVTTCRVPNAVKCTITHVMVGGPVKNDKGTPAGQVQNDVLLNGIQCCPSADNTCSKSTTDCANEPEPHPFEATADGRVDYNKPSGQNPTKEKTQ